MAGSDTQNGGRVVGGRYLLGPRRGSGVDAAVFDAFDQQLQRVVAMKVVHPDLSSDPEFQRAFSQTMEVVSSLHHPNIAVLYDWGTDVWNGRETLYVIVEHLSGGSLRDVLDRGRLLSPSQALLVGLDACKGLDALHHAGLVHGDIRPSTLVFGDDRRLRLIDVGLGQLLTDDLWSRPNEVANDRAMYAAPELAAGEGREPRSDVYSLCITLLEAVTGRVPFAGDSTVATLANRVDKLMPVSADLGPLASVFERAGRPVAADRYTAAEFGRALVQTADKLPRPAPLPLPGAGLFADRPVAGAPVDPTGPLSRVALADLPAEDGPAPEEAAAAAAAVEPPPDAAAPRRRRVSGRAIAIGIAMVLLLAAVVGGVAWFATRTDSAPVPSLAGLTEGEALNAVSGHGWQTLVTPAASDTVPVGQVIGTRPPAGTELEAGKTLELLVSTGPAPRVLGELVGLTLADATAVLVAQDLLVVQVDPVFDETVPAGSVVSWSVPEQPSLRAGDTVTPGTTVQLVLSAGPQPRTVPSLAGLNEAQAIAVLAEQGLVLNKLPDQFSSTTPVGIAVGQDPATGQTVARDSAVSAAFSKGPDLVTMPPLAGLDLPTITTTLQGAGFAVGAVTGDTAAPLIAAQVAGQTVDAGQQFPRGTTVDLVFTPLP